VFSSSGVPRRDGHANTFWGESGVEQVHTPHADAGQEEVHFSVRALLADLCFAPCTGLKDAEAKVEDGKATWTLKKKKSEITYEVPEASASPEEIALLRKWLEAEMSRVAVDSKSRNNANMLNVFLNMLPEGQAPSKPWSAAA
jgi:hypothetical protein